MYLDILSFYYFKIEFWPWRLHNRILLFIIASNSPLPSRLIFPSSSLQIPFSNSFFPPSSFTLSVLVICINILYLLFPIPHCSINFSTSIFGILMDYFSAFSPFSVFDTPKVELTSSWLISLWLHFRDSVVREWKHPAGVIQTFISGKVFHFQVYHLKCEHWTKKPLNSFLDVFNVIWLWITAFFSADLHAESNDTWAALTLLFSFQIMCAFLSCCTVV